MNNKMKEEFKKLIDSVDTPGLDFKENTSIHLTRKELKKLLKKAAEIGVYDWNNSPR